MAEKEKRPEQNPVPQGSDQGEKPGGILLSIVVILLALLVVAVVTIGVFYFAVKNNVNGFAHTVKPQIENHPLLKFALPDEMRAEEEKPENLTEKQLLKKYDEYRVKVAELNESLSAANATIEQMQNDARSDQELEAVTEENRRLLESIKAEQMALEEEQKILADLMVKGDTEGFKEYFQNINKETAEIIYKEVVIREALNAEKVESAKPFSLMEPINAAGVLKELFIQDQSSALDIFEGLKPNASALILEKMDAKTAAEITKLLSARK